MDIITLVQAIRVFELRHSLLENIREAGEKLHRSYPVSADGTLDDVHGYARVRELFVHNLTGADPSNWQPLVRPVLRINGKASLTQLLAAFLENREIAALVCSDEGANIGWFTETLMGAR